MSIFEFPWWVYVSLVFSFFGICMGLNYLVKKLNEAKIEERLIRMLQKASTTQSTQVTGPLIAEETSGAVRLNSLKTIQQPSPPGISLVFNREENKRRGDPYSLIKPTIPRLSMETVNIISPSERTVSSVPLKRNESAHVAKTNSSHILTEKVFVKTNEYGNQAVKKTSSTAKSDCYVTQLITVRKNEYGHVSGLGAYSVARKRSNTSEFDSEIEDISLTSRGSTPSSHVKDEKAEETVSKERSDVTEKVLFQNIYTSRIIRTKTSIVDITVEKQGVNDNKSNEEIDTGCSIKKSVESIISKITLNLKNKNEDSKKDKHAEDTLIAAKQSSSNTGSILNVPEISSAEKEESRCSAAKETSSPVEIDHIWENYPVQNIESEYITSSDSKSKRVEGHIESEHTVANKSSSYSCIGRVDENISIQKVESRNTAPKESTSIHSYSTRTEDNIPVKKVESGYFDTKATTSSYSKDERVGGNILARKVESGHIATKDITCINSYSTRTEVNIPVKKVESGHFDTRETIPSNSKDERVGENILARKVESGDIATNDITCIHSYSTRTEVNIPVKKVESGHFDTKVTIPSNSKDERVGENILARKVESRHIATKDTNCINSYSTRTEDNIPVKKVGSEHFDTKETTLSYSKDKRIGGNILAKKVESGHIATKETTCINSHSTRTEDNIPVKKIESVHSESNEIFSSYSKDDRVGENKQAKKAESGHIASKETASTHSHSKCADIDNTPVKKFVPGQVATKETTSVHSLERVGENITIKRVELGHIAAKETSSSHSKNDRVEENVPVKRSESEHIAAKETILYAGINAPIKEAVSVKKSVTLIESRRDDSEKSSSILPTNYKTREYAAVKKLDSGRNTNETVPHTRSNPIVTAPSSNEEGATDRTRAKASPFQIQSGITVRKQSIKKHKAAPIANKETLNTKIDDNIAESGVVKMNKKAAHNAVNAKRSKELVLEMKKEDIESDSSIKKIEDSTVLSGTSKTTYDPDEEEVEEPIKTLTDKIKELLEDEDIVELKLYKPSQSSKK